MRSRREEHRPRYQRDRGKKRQGPASITTSPHLSVSRTPLLTYLLTLLYLLYIHTYRQTPSLPEEALPPGFFFQNRGVLHHRVRLQHQKKKEKTRPEIRATGGGPPDLPDTFPTRHRITRLLCGPPCSGACCNSPTRCAHMRSRERDRLGMRSGLFSIYSTTTHPFQVVGKKKKKKKALP